METFCTLKGADHFEEVARLAARRHSIQKYEAFENGLSDAGGLLERDESS